MLATSEKLLAHPQASEIVTILVVSGYDEDHHTLQAIFSHRNWRIQKAQTYGEARKFLRDCQAAVVLCEKELLDGSWKDVLYELALLQDAPQLIVVSRLADEQLWGEVLNLGGYDVLEKPFDPSEVMRAVSMAYRHHCGNFFPSLLPPPQEPSWEPRPFPVSFSSN
jgi:DNA-binding response OmpR family regulator